MKIDNQFLATVRNISENYFFNLYFFNVDISLIMHAAKLTFYICIKTLLLREMCLRILISPGSLYL